MTSKPTVKGVYRIKNLVENGPCYMQANTDSSSNPYVEMKVLDTFNPKQKWTITPLGDDKYLIASSFDNSGLVEFKSTSGGKGTKLYPIPRANTQSATWKLTQYSDKYAKISLYDGSSKVFQPDGQVLELLDQDNEDLSQRWVFELVSSTSAQKGYQSMFFTLTVEEAMKQKYDIIIIGTGVGGGVIAADLFETNSMLGKHAKSVLVIEKGGLVFHSHCLNAARPSGLNQDRGQQNDTFFAKFKMEYTLSKETDRSDWKGGPMYCLGGRSAAWGLFAPRIHDKGLYKYFPSTVADDLVTTYYRAAEKLMDLSLPVTTTTHQDLMERLNMEIGPEVQWQWGRIASEFRPDGNFDFAQGAYSTIDKLLEIAMSKPIDKDGKEQEHENFKILLDTAVRKILWDKNNASAAAGVLVRTTDNQEHEILLKEGGTIVLAAGTVQSAAILLRSGVDLAGHGGLHVTDHDIIYKAQPFRYLNPSARTAIGPMKLQTYVEKFNSEDMEEIVLANMSIDASSFLPRGYTQYDDFPKWIIAIIRACELNPRNTVQLVSDEPVVTILRDKEITDKDQDILELQKITEKAMDTIDKVLKVQFFADDEWVPNAGSYFRKLELGGVAHELGTIPMKRGDLPDAPYCLDETLKLKHKEGIYVCDLSVFPWSPEVNPTVTLAALALRLSRTVLLPRNILFGDDNTPMTPDPNAVYVVNHTGQTIKVWVSNKAGVQPPRSEPTKDVKLGPGEFTKATRSAGTLESVAVYKLAFKSSGTEFVNTPELHVAAPGSITSINQ